MDLGKFRKRIASEKGIKNYALLALSLSELWYTIVPTQNNLR